MHKRFTELYKDGDWNFNEMLVGVADHLLANGVIAPPCKVGDIVWDRNGEPHKVISIEWYSKKVMHLHCEKHTFSVGKRSIGKTVFLTKEEAEQALKEREQSDR